MDDKYWEALAERWEALRKAGKVRWADGMWDDEGWAVVWVDEAAGRFGLAFVDATQFTGVDTINMPWLSTKPDLEHPATVGVLLSQWREACGDPFAHVAPPTEDANFRKIFELGEGWVAWPSEQVGKTEPEAIIAALEALPSPA